MAQSNIHHYIALPQKPCSINEPTYIKFLINDIGQILESSFVYNNKNRESRNL